jgi:hypothetical protein
MPFDRRKLTRVDVLLAEYGEDDRTNLASRKQLD